MIKDIKLKVIQGFYGHMQYTVELNDNDPLSLVNITGLGLPQIAPLYKNPKSVIDSNELVGFDIPPRRIKLTLQYSCSSVEDFNTLRSTLYKAFFPLSLVEMFRYEYPDDYGDDLTRIGLEITREDDSVRQIDVRIDKGLDFKIDGTSEWGETSGIITLDLIAHYPIWYDPTIEDLTIGNDETLPLWDKTTALDIEDTTFTMFPEFYIHGPFDTLLFELFAPNGDRYGEFQMSNLLNNDYSIILTPFIMSISHPELSDSSPEQIHTLSIPCEAYHGSDTVNLVITGDGADGNSEIVVKYAKAYLGI